MLNKHKLLNITLLIFLLNVLNPLAFAQSEFEEEWTDPAAEAASQTFEETDFLIEEFDSIEEQVELFDQPEESVEENSPDTEDTAVLEDEDSTEELPDQEIEETEPVLQKRESIRLDLPSKLIVKSDTDNFLRADTQTLHILPDIQALNTAYPNLEIGSEDFINTTLELEITNRGNIVKSPYQLSNGFVFSDLELRIEKDDIIRVTLPSIIISQENIDYFISFIEEDLIVMAGEKTLTVEEESNKKTDLEEASAELEAREGKAENSKPEESDILFENSEIENSSDIDNAADLEKVNGLKKSPDIDLIGEELNLVQTEERDLEEILTLDKIVEELMSTYNQPYVMTVNLNDYLIITTDTGGNYNGGTKKVFATVNTAGAVQHLKNEIKKVTGKDIVITKNVFKKIAMTLTIEDSGDSKSETYAETSTGYVFTDLHKQINSSSIISLTLESLLLQQDGEHYLLNFIPHYPNVKPARLLRIESYPSEIIFEPITKAFVSEVVTKQIDSSQIVIADNHPNGQWTLKGKISTALNNGTQTDQLDASLFNGSSWVEVKPTNSWIEGTKEKASDIGSGQYQLNLDTYKLKLNPLQAQGGRYHFTIQWTLEVAPD